ncbi:MAG: hypothetical protein IIZ40_03485 [Bacilli bacterium]|nr:hypothetical protein [Bacilli bacterium]
MRKYLPKNDTIKEEYKNMTCYSNLNMINVWLHKNIESDFTDIVKILKKYDYHLINIGNIYSVNVINRLIYILKKCNYKGRVVLDLIDNNYDNKKDGIIRGLDNDSKINLSSIPKYVKISGFDSNNRQTEFTAWAHNLNIKDKKRLIVSLTDNSRDKFLDQEIMIISFKDELLKKCPNFNNLKPKEKMNFLYEYIRINFPYSFDSLNKEGTGVNMNSLWAENPLKVYENRKGLNIGRSNLLALVSNNSLIKVNCTVAEGNKNGVKHSWNQFIDDEKIYNYDLAYSLKDMNMGDIKKNNYSIDRMYPSVIKSYRLNKNKQKKKLILIKRH